MSQQQGYRQAQAAYGNAMMLNNPRVQDPASKQLQQSYTKAIKSIQGSLDNPQEYQESFIIKEILKVGEVYRLLRNEIDKWSRLKNKYEASAKNKELKQYILL